MIKLEPTKDLEALRDLDRINATQEEIHYSNDLKFDKVMKHRFEMSMMVS